MNDDQVNIDELVQRVLPVDANAAAAARARHDRLAKPPGSLGRLEDVGVRLAAIARRCPPPEPVSPVVIVAAGDHGVHAEGISDWPQAVTSAMVTTVAAGRASVNAIAGVVGARVEVLDVGTMSGGALVRAGTRNLAVEPAMEPGECRAAVMAGAERARELVAGGADLVATGDLGIGNTTASACLIAAFTGAAPAEVTGRGANLDDGRTARKIDVVEKALARHGGADRAANADRSVQADRADRDPFTMLASLGGLEHAALVGVMLAGAAARVPVVLDGVIADAAALAAVALCPNVRDYLIPGHASTEPGAVVALTALEPALDRPALIDLRMRLGEGTGSALAVPIVRAAARLLTDVATLDELSG